MSGPSRNQSSGSRAGKGKARGTPSPDKPADRPPSAQIDFEFLNFTHPSDAKASRARRTVRSHVTRQQHQREQHAAALARRSKSAPQQSVESSLPRPPPRLQKLQTHPGTISEGEASPLSQASQPSPIPASGSEQSSSVPSTTVSPLQSPSGSPAAQCDPFALYPLEWHSSIPVVIDYYITNLATDNVDLDGVRNKGLLRSVWFPFVLQSATLLHSVMLLAATHCAATRGPESHSIDIYGLRGMAIRGINEDLANPTKSLSDELVGAILTMASYEAIFGDSNTCATHLSGLSKIIELRGGLMTLGLNRLLERILLWVDSNVSFLTGMEHFFDKTRFPTDIGHPVPDPVRFGARRPSQTQSW